LGEDLSNQRDVEKILVCLPEKFQAKISCLKENKNFFEITVVELVNALQASEQRKSLRMEVKVEGALLASNKGKNQSFKSFWKKKFPPYPHCKKILI